MMWVNDGGVISTSDECPSEVILSGNTQCEEYHNLHCPSHTSLLTQEGHMCHTWTGTKAYV